MAIGRVPGETGIQPSIVTAKGDLIVATANGSVTNQAVGTNNQVLMADSAQADGVKWANEATATLTTTGDMLYASAANTLARRAIGSTGDVLTVSGGLPTWAAPSSGGMTLISTTTFSTGTVSLTSIASTYVDLVLVIAGLYGSTDTSLNIQFNTDTSANYAIYRGTTLSDGQAQISVTNAITPSTSVYKVGYGIIHIPRYSSNSNKFCQIRLSAAGTTTDLYIQNQGIWASTAAISSVQLKMGTGTFSGGTVALYGVK